MEKVASTEKSVMECLETEEELRMPHDFMPTCICLVGNVATDESVQEAAKAFGVPVLISNDGCEVAKDPLAICVLDDFSGPLFDLLRINKQRIYGPTAIRELAASKKFPEYKRPLYCLSMKGLVVLITGFRDRREIGRLMNLMHYMGAGIRIEDSSEVTHLLANTVSGSKYQYAVTYRIPILSTEWVHHAWAMRAQVGFNAAKDILAEHKLKALYKTKVCFLGFPDEERKHMSEILVENGGIPTDIEDPQLSHVVLDSADTYHSLKKPSNQVKTYPEQVSPPQDLEISIYQEPASTSTPKYLNISTLSSYETEIIAEELQIDNHCIKKPRTESPKDKIFKTPTRLGIVRRSLRLKKTNVLSKWISSLDVNLGRQEPEKINDIGTDFKEETLNQLGKHLSFTSVPMSLIRTFSMMLGEIDFLGTYVHPFHLNSGDGPTLPYPLTAFFILGLFMVLMPILLMNLLIGLAVGDIESVRRNAQLKRLAMQVVLHTELERKLPQVLLERVDKMELIEYPNECKGKLGFLDQLLRMWFCNPFSEDGLEMVLENNEDFMTEEMGKMKRKLKDISKVLEAQGQLLKLIVQKMEIKTEADEVDEGVSPKELQISQTAGSKWTSPRVRSKLKTALSFSKAQPPK